MHSIHTKLAAIGTAICMTLLSAGGAFALEKVKVTMASASNNYAPYVAAIEKGYFKEEGFDVQIIKAGGGVATPALMSGDVHFSTSGSSALSAILRGAPIKLVFFPWERPSYQLWSTKPEITTVAQLKGKAVGIQTRGDTFEVALRLVLKARGMGGNSIIYTPLGYGGGRRAAISSGSLPAAVLGVLDVERLRGSEGLKRGHMLVNMFDEVRMPYTGIAVGTKALKDDPARVKRFVKACIKGLAYFSAYKDASIDIVQKYNKRASRKAIEVDYASVRASRTVDGTVSVALQRQDALIRAEIIGVPKDKILPVSQIFDFRLAKEVNKELKAAGWKPTK